jgi:telomerase Cajal body protein 1
VFSISNPGPPHTSIPTKSLFPSTKGIISALSVSSGEILAAGTFNNVVSLFSSSYEHISTFQTSKGSGITQIKWSPDSRYMYIIPRQSQDIEVWDIRSTGDVAGVLTGRRAHTNQRIWADLSSDGSLMVSGGTDGMVRGWKTDAVTGTVQPSIEFAVHDGVLLI